MLSDMIDQGVSLSPKLIESDLGVDIMPPMFRLNIRLKSADRTAIQKETGLTFPSKVGQSFMKNEVLIACMGPDEWGVIAQHKSRKSLEKALAKASKKFILSVTDVSERNVGMFITGPHSNDAINMGCPLDLSLEAFPIGKTVRTVFESASIFLRRVDHDDWHIECWRSFAPYIIGFMEKYAREL